MKKTALLFTILCASALNGMETKRSFWDSLPQELQNVIVAKALESSESLYQAIDALRTASTLHGAEFDKLFSEPEDFTAVVHMLSDKFKAPTDFVAELFNTPAAKTYRELGLKLLALARFGGPEQMTKLINQGADVNFSSYSTPLSVAITNSKAEEVKLLLDAGAKPTKEDLVYATKITAFNPNSKEANTIQRLIDQAYEKITK